MTSAGSQAQELPLPPCWGRIIHLFLAQGVQRGQGWVESRLRKDRGLGSAPLCCVSLGKSVPLSESPTQEGLAS